MLIFIHVVAPPPCFVFHLPYRTLCVFAVGGVCVYVADHVLLCVLLFFPQAAIPISMVISKGRWMGRWVGPHTLGSGM